MGFCAFRNLSTTSLRCGSRSLISKKKFSSRNNFVSSIPNLNLFKNAIKYNSKISVISQEGKFTFSDLLKDSEKLSQTCLLKSQQNDLNQERIALICSPGYKYVVGQWSVWRSGGIFVPLCTTHPPPEIEYVLKDSQISIAITDSKHEGMMKELTSKLNIRLISLEKDFQFSKDSGISTQIEEQSKVSTFPFTSDASAMIIYTSGTTGKPKGVVTTHANIEAQVVSMIEPWGWSSNDHILHTLPLHHVHGVVNVLTVPLYAGAICEIMPKFNAKLVWERFIKGDSLNLYMAVPTIYENLIEEYQKMPADLQKKAREACKRFRLMVSGSMALNPTTFNRWKEISGHVLLERYGMTEIGMGLTNPLSGPRIPGTVGKPFPKVQVKLVDPTTGNPVKVNESGELLFKGPSVFKEYWNRPEETKKAFDKDGWFKSGDIASCNEEGVYKIWGRASSDIIKSGGYLISALEIETHLREHPDIDNCQVVGVPDPKWGQIIAGLVILKKGKTMTLEQLHDWAVNKMAKYKVPRMLKLVDSFPRNAMGKINKKELVKLYFPESSK